MHQRPEQHIVELRLEYTARFRHICRQMHVEDFAQLIDEMVRVRCKYEELEAELARRPPLDGLADV